MREWESKQIKRNNKQVDRIKELEEELADYKEGTEGLKLCVGDLRDERDRLRKVLNDVVNELAEGNIEEAMAIIDIVLGNIKLPKH